MTVSAFFAYARDRHLVHLRRAAGDPPPWSDDPIMQSTRFCNVYRELDRTTQWFAKHVRDPMRDEPEVLLATMVFRWFNRISTGEAIFCQPDLFDNGFSAWGNFLKFKDTRHLKRAIVSYLPKGPYVTGAYTINTRSAGLGLSKLDGVLKLIEMWLEGHTDWREVALWNQVGRVTLQDFCTWVQSPCLGPFMAYEVACDLRHTALLGKATDVMTWANLGPGAQRGLNRIYRPTEPVNKSIRPEQALEEMRELLRLSRDAKYWPQGHKSTAQGAQNVVDWPKWEMREVEHVLCESDKHSRVKMCQGRPRGSFNGRARL